MTRRAAPLVAVVEHRREKRALRFTMPDGGVAMVCGVAMSVDHLVCGHTVEVAGGGKAKRRRCGECAAVRAEEDAFDELERLRAIDEAAGSDRCGGCGCTDNYGCGFGCWWAAPGLCSECADMADVALDLVAETGGHLPPFGYRPTELVDTGGLL